MHSREAVSGVYSVKRPEGPVYGPEISPKQREKICPAWERAYHHYHDRKGMDMPYTYKMIQKSRTEGTVNQSFMPWASLTSADFPVQ